MVGIYDCFGYVVGYDVSFEERYKLLPFDGSIEWAQVMKKIARSVYQGATTLEPMNWDYEQLSIQSFLDLAYQRAKKLDELRTVEVG